MSKSATSKSDTRQQEPNATLRITSESASTEEVKTTRVPTELGPQPLPINNPPVNNLSLIGQTIGPYLILEELGCGGMAIVYKARHLTLDRIVAIKEIQQNFCKEPRFLKRFQSEARTAARILHPHVITLYEHMNFGDRHFLVLEYIAGGTLYDRWKDQIMPVNEAINALSQLLSGLDAIHSENIVHRDLKPQNVLIDARGNLKIADFGLAHLLGDNLSTVMGTVRYMPPETCAEDQRNAAIDQRVDIYALGLMIYELLLGAEHFQAVMAEQPGFNNSVPGWLVWHCNCETRLPLLDTVRADVPHAFAQIIDKMIAKDREQRYFDAPAIMRDLNQAQAGINQAVINQAAINNASTLEAPENLIEPPAKVKSAAAVTVQPQSVSKISAPLMMAIISAVLLAAAVGLYLWNSRSNINTVPVTAPVANNSNKVADLYADMVLIPAGQFQMGSNNGTDDVKPVHAVFVEAFYLDKTEVTNGQYRKFCDATGRSYPDNPDWNGNYFLGNPDHPVVGVSWEDADAYAAWSKKRLPTEAEWEKAARGASNSRWPWGNSWNDPTIANVDGGEDKFIYTAPVGSFKQGGSSYGPLDMIGNVWEWVADRYQPYPGGKALKEYQQDYRVVRGGGYVNGPARAALDASFRGYAPPKDLQSDLRFAIGFRCAADVKR